MRKGEYRGIRTALIHDADFLKLSPAAKLVFYTLKLQLGPSGIDTFYPTALADQTGLDDSVAHKALDELKAANWIRYESNVFWIRNGLKFDPCITLENQNHRPSIIEHLKSLPRLRIVEEFASYYELPPPRSTELDTDDPSSGMVDGIPDRMADGIPDGMGDTGGDQGEGRREEGKGKGKENMYEQDSVRQDFYAFCDYFTLVTDRKILERSELRFSAYMARRKHWSDNEMRSAVVAAAGNDFLTGRDPKKPNSCNHLTINYILSPDNMEKWINQAESAPARRPGFQLVEKVL